MPGPFGQGVLVLQQHEVARSAGEPVELAPHREQRVDWCAKVVEGAVEHRQHSGQVGRERPLEHVDVAESAAAVLQVGFEQRADLAEAVPSLLGGVAQSGQPAQRSVVPLFDCAGSKRLDRRFVAGQVTDGEQRGRGRQVVARQTRATTSWCGPTG